MHLEGHFATGKPIVALFAHFVLEIVANAVGFLPHGGHVARAVEEHGLIAGVRGISWFASTPGSANEDDFQYYA